MSLDCRLESSESLESQGLEPKGLLASAGRFARDPRAGKKPGDWTAAELERFAPEFTPDMARLLDAREGMRSREILGGTGPQAVAQALAEARARLARLAA